MSNGLEMTSIPQDLRNQEMDDVIQQIFGSPTSGKKNDPPAVHTISNELKKGKGPVVNSNGLNTEDADPEHPLLANHYKDGPPTAGGEVDDLGDDQLTNHTLDTKRPDDEHPEILINGVKDSEEDDLGIVDIRLSHDNEHENPANGTRISGFDLDQRFGSEDRPVSTMPGTIIPDVNTYQQKKNLAQGMMDLALLSANANQLRYVLESSSSGHPYYYSSIICILLSIVLQVAVGIGLILNSRYNVKDDKDICKADKINNMTVLGIFLITIANVFIASFSVAPSSTGINTTTPVRPAG